MGGFYEHRFVVLMINSCTDGNTDDADADAQCQWALNSSAKNNTSERTIVPWTVIFDTSPQIWFNDKLIEERNQHGDIPSQSLIV